jgi:hypothetical protein
VTRCRSFCGRTLEGSFLDRVTHASDSASGRDGNHVPTRGMKYKEADAAASLPKAKPCFVDPLQGLEARNASKKDGK